MTDTTDFNTLMPVAGMQHALTVKYGADAMIEIMGGQPVSEDGEQVIDMERCVSIRMKNKGDDDAHIYIGFDMACDLARGVLLALWSMSSWRERLAMAREFFK